MERVVETTKIDVHFLFFRDCPNSEPTLRNLASALYELGMESAPVTVEVDPECFDQPFLGSPSIVVNGIDLYSGTTPTEFEFACRTFVIDGHSTGVLPVAFIRDRLVRMLDPDA
jgi:hypothetical protein